MKIGAIVLSRMGSSRLPGKALKKIKKKSIIDYVIERVLLIENIDQVIIATSYRKIDELLIKKFSSKKNIKTFRGSHNNVSLRFLKCMEKYNLDAAIRINGDSPLHNFNLINKLVKIYIKKKPDVLSNVFPRSYPVGMSIEIISYNALKIALSKMSKKSDFEHVTKYFYENNDQFNILNFSQLPTNHSTVHLAVDTEKDFDRFNWIINELGPDYLEAEYNKILKIYNAYEKK